MKRVAAPRYSIYPGNTSFEMDQIDRKKPPKYVDQRKVLRYLNLDESDSSDDSNESTEQAVA